MYRMFLRRCSPEVVLSRAERRRSKSHSGATWPSPPCWSQSPAGLVEDSTNSLNHVTTLRCSDNVPITHLLHDLLYDLYACYCIYWMGINMIQRRSIRILHHACDILWHLVTFCDLCAGLRSGSTRVMLRGNCLQSISQRRTVSLRLATDSPCFAMLCPLGAMQRVTKWQHAYAGFEVLSRILLSIKGVIVQLCSINCSLSWLSFQWSYVKLYFYFAYRPIGPASCTGVGPRRSLHLGWPEPLQCQNCIELQSARQSPEVSDARQQTIIQP